ncbi:hypothetical protein pb186bvf_009282 [Paramecium bursaria]
MGQSEVKKQVINDARYGQADLMVKDGKEFVVKKIVVLDEEQYKIWALKKLDHPNLVQIYEHKLESQKELCSNYNMMLWIMEYIPTSLHKEIQNRTQQSKQFTEDELWKMLTDIVDLLQFMQQNGLAHQNIRPLTISYQPQQLKLIDQYNGNTAFQTCFTTPESQKLYDLSPKLLKAIHQQNSNPRHNIFKSDVFSLGMSFLQMSLLNNARDSYDYENGTVNVTEYLKLTQKKYSQRYAHIVSLMLEQNESQRPDFEQLQKIIAEPQIKSIKSSQVIQNLDVGNSMQLQSVQNSYDQTQSVQELSQDKPDEIKNPQEYKIQGISKEDLYQQQTLRIKTRINIPFQQSRQKSTIVTARQSTIKTPVKSSPKKQLGYFQFSDSIKPTKQPQQYSRELSNDIPVKSQPSYISNGSSIKPRKFVQSLAVKPEPEPDYQIINTQYMMSLDSQIPQQLQSAEFPQPSKKIPIILLKLNMRDLGQSRINKDYPATYQRTKMVKSTENGSKIYHQSEYSFQKPNGIQDSKQILNSSRGNQEMRRQMESMIEDNKKRVFQNISYNNGSKYLGEMIENNKDGYGKLIFSDGGFYDGDWKNDRMNGFGILYFKDGQKAYEGYFADDQFHGNGTLYNRNPIKLMNQFDYSDFNQIGDYWIKYVGQFQYDCKQGQGTLYLTNGEKYQGEFNNDYVEGFGQFGNFTDSVVLFDSEFSTIHFRSLKIFLRNDIVSV